VVVSDSPVLQILEVEVVVVVDQPLLVVLVARAALEL
jgi:hypothetical protein